MPSPASPAFMGPTLVGAAAIVMWSSMALLASWIGPIPPFELMSMAFAVATLLMLAKWAWFRQSPVAAVRQPWGAWLAGVGAYFGYHFLYLFAIQNAPVIEASLINYLWPLLIVLFSSRLPGHRLGWQHVAGGLCGLAGTVVLVSGGGPIAPGEHLRGDLAAGAAAFIWAGYSVFIRRYRAISSDAIGGYCAATAILAWIAHVLLEPTVMPQGAQWLAILGLGLGPVGAAFLAWDHGVKHGNLRMLGILSYAAPVLSSAWLILAGRAPLSAAVAIACLLVVSGAVLGSLGRQRESGGDYLTLPATDVKRAR